MEKRYFESPESAVEAIRAMIRAESWADLACYYDISGTSWTQEEISQEEFFIRRERPEVAHPAGFWRYKHPFPPSFSYDGIGLSEGDEVKVQVSIWIQQGDMTQHGTKEFFLRESEAGYQLLPPKETTTAESES